MSCYDLFRNGGDENMEKKEVRFTLRLSKEQHTDLKQLADEHALSIADYLRMLIAKAKSSNDKD